MRSLSPMDLHTLQHDVLSRPEYPAMPSMLATQFDEWLRDHGAVERETMRAPENEGETRAAFFEYVVDFSEASAERALAAALLRGGPVLAQCLISASPNVSTSKF